MTDENRLGSFLKDRRARLDPASFGFAGRRRTPGLRREEVAQRANISATWYTWLEQGRGGAPSAQVLENVASALMLTAVETEHLFFLGLGRPPKPRQSDASGVSPRLQRLLDALIDIPATVKTATWDVIAWNKAARAVLKDYAAQPPEARNVLRMMFLDPEARARQDDWQSIARFVVATFRADVARAGGSAKADALVAELSASSPAFVAMWNNNDVGNMGEGVKRLRHPKAGLLALEYSNFAVDGRQDLSLVVYNPATDEDAARIRQLCADLPSD